MKQILPEETRPFFDRELPGLSPITPQTRQENLRRQFTGGVRINQGRYRTAEEEYARRDRILAAPLP
ncbi:MAG TPA: hypothetical protein DCM45_02115 [Clostridiales bacterium]|nr:hypothetical protein [Clostridiales bacterium]